MFHVIFPEFDHYAMVIKIIPLISAAHAEIVKVGKGMLITLAHNKYFRKLSRNVSFPSILFPLCCLMI